MDTRVTREEDARRRGVGHAPPVFRTSYLALFRTSLRELFLASLAT